MLITPAQKNKILQVVNVFETGTPEGRYDSISVYKDGLIDGNHVYQLTYGRSQTTEFGNLKRLIEKYVSNGGLYTAQFAPFVSKIGNWPSLRHNPTFRKLLKESALKDPIMRVTQDDFFDLYYYTPAYIWFKGFGFKEPLSLLVIYDSFIQSGQIFDFLRQKFPERPPLFGGRENVWIEQYVKTRHDWLKTHTKPIVRKTFYRTSCFKKQIARSNWVLNQEVDSNGVIIL